MLTTLRRIIQEVNAAPELNAALQTLVQRVREALNTQAATLFLIDNHRAEYILMATDGLNLAVAGELRVPLDVGLVGLVGRREEPINTDNAPAHPKFYHHPLAGEENYRAFLGVPIIHHRRLLGVLAVQQERQRHFDESEEAFLVTIAAQVATVLAHAEAVGEIAKLTPFKKTDYTDEYQATLSGTPSVSGVGIGTAVVVYPLADLDAVPERQADDPKKEIQLIKSALKEARQEIKNLSARVAQAMPREANDLFDVYLRVLADASLGKEIISEIRQGHWAQGALRKVITRHINRFEAMEDDYLRERASDFRDLGRRILARLQANVPKRLDYPEQTILIGDEVMPSALAEVPEGQLAGVISGRGSNNAHVAILARALGVPTVMGAKGAQLTELDNEHIVVDGYFGQVYVNPKPSVLKEFEVLAREERELDQSLEYLRHQPAQTPDEHHVALLVNTGLAGDATPSLTVGAEGVGLFRTEVPFMIRERFPAEKEQQVIYQQLLKAFAPRPVTMRTLDIGGDKSLPYFPIEEDNPALGWRGMRVTLDHPELFLIQVRAMMRANAAFNNLKILLPMISSLGEVDEALHLINQAYQEIVEEGVAVNKPEVGVMIEIPSAVYQAHAIAERVDFVSVGSNDLTQYLLAVDRNNTRVSGLYDPLHPAMLRALCQVVESVHRAGKTVGICGEMASDPVAVLLLLAMGFDTFSMNAKSLLRMKWVITTFSLSEARQLLDQVMKMDNAALIRFHLEKAIDQAGLGGLIRAGKR